MRKLVGVLCFAVAAAGLMLSPRPGLAAEQPDTASLQSQIDELRQELGKLEEIKARLAELEEQLRGAQAVEKKVEAEQVKH